MPIISERIEYNLLPLHKVFHWDVVTFIYLQESFIRGGNQSGWLTPILLGGSCSYRSYCCRLNGDALSITDVTCGDKTSFTLLQWE